MTSRKSRECLLYGMQNSRVLPRRSCGAENPREDITVEGMWDCHGCCFSWHCCHLGWGPSYPRQASRSPCECGAQLGGGQLRSL